MGLPRSIFSFTLPLGAQLNKDGTGTERITYGSRFDSFPMFSKDGKKLVWCSTRKAKGQHEFNIFIADWKD